MTCSASWRAGVWTGCQSSAGRVSAAPISDSASGSARDHLIVRAEPKKRPHWMSPEEQARTPAALRVREVQAGGKIMFTTLLCPKATPKPMLQALYRQRLPRMTADLATDA